MTATVGTVAPNAAYRHDIDGLRAISILLVVAFHTGWDRLSGGYVGVDVFFVLSGFLITGLLLREHRSTGSIDLKRFYARRARRLLPLSALVLISTTAAGFILLPPLSRIELLRDARAAALYFANWRYSVQATAYSDAEVTDSLLLHYWSLSIEEQYYFVWPLLIVLAGWIVARRGRGNVEPAAAAILAIVVAVSLTSAVLLTEQLGPSAYYVTFTRIWEMGVGALLAFFLPRLGHLRRGAGDLLSLAGLAAIGLSAITLDATSPFPGTLALIPVFGTVAVLIGGAVPGSRVAALLSLGPAQALGRWSYAWYLWHWPVIGVTLLVNERLDEPLARRPTVIAAVLISLLISALSHRWFETPLRYNRWLALGNRPSLAVGAILTVIPAALFSAVLLGGGLGGNPVVLTVDVPEVAGSPDDAVGYEFDFDPMTPSMAAEDREAPGVANCHLGFPAVELETGADCVAGDPDGDRTIIITGDSHADHWVPALHLAGQVEGTRIIPHTKSACTPLDVTVFNETLGRAYTECDRWRRATIEDIAERYGTVDAVVIARSLGYRNLIMDGDSRLDLNDDKRRQWQEGSERSFYSWASVTDRVIVLRDTPWAAQDVPTCLADPSKVPAQCNLTLSDTAERDAIQYFAEWLAAEAVGADPNTTVNIRFADPTPLICAREDCPMVTPDGIIKYRDRHHLTSTYARSIAQDFWQLLPLAVTEDTGS